VFKRYSERCSDFSGGIGVAGSERRRRLREALIESAERAIAERGLAGLKARELAQEAGCALGAIYTVFPDLDALILEVNLRTLTLFGERIAAAEEGVPAPTDAAAAEDDLVRLALAYLAFAREHPLRWRALFQHRMTGDVAPPNWYLKEQGRLFSQIERPLSALCPAQTADERALLARTLFSATHGMVSLGLDEKLMALPAAVLAREVERVVRATARGLAGVE
jgi:AcrR family transcriptional regulator